MARRSRKAPESRPAETYTPVDAQGNAVPAPQLFQALFSPNPFPYQMRKYWFLHGHFIPEINQDWAALICDDYRQLLYMRQDWQNELYDVLTIYQHARFTEIHGVDENRVQIAIDRIESAARKLKECFDYPKQEPGVYEAAWMRLNDFIFDDSPDNPALHPITYPGLSLIIAKAAAMRKQRKRELAASSLEILIINLATFVERHGWKATVSNSLSKMDDHLNLTPFGRLVKACIECSRLEPPCALTASALNKAIGRVLKKRRDNSA